MGQYYHPINIESMEWVYSHDYGEGLKLMEHSYLGNDFVGVVMTLLKKGGRWYKKRLVWCGDYYDEDDGEDDGEDGRGYYDRCEDDKKVYLKPMPSVEQLNYVIVNHTKKEYVDLRKFCVDVTAGLGEDLITHPLPLLTALGNGGGGGDYEGTNMDKVGYWARDTISAETEAPERYKELEIRFKEA